LNQPIQYVVVLAVAIPLVLYVWAAYRTPRELVSTPRSYFIAFRRVGRSPFADSSLAYAFQVATLFPFLFWGLQGQILPALANAICWGLGIALFRRHLPSVLATLGAPSAPKTLHGLLGDFFSSLIVQRVAAWTTITGMVGLALAEAYWGMQVLRVLVHEDTPSYYALVFCALLFVLTYVWYGGTYGSMKTDMLQLVISYICFSSVFVYLLATVASSGSSPRPEAAIVSAFMCVGGALLIFFRLRTRVMPISAMAPNNLAASEQAGAVTTDDVWDRAARWLSRATFAAIAILALCFVWYLFRALPTARVSTLLNPGDPGWIGVAALVVLPLGFQFVDMSAWQRLQAIGGGPDQIEESAKRGLLVFVIESPFSWILCLALGTLIGSAMPAVGLAADKAGPLAAFPRLLLESGTVLHGAVAVLFMIAVMAVMFSTIDSVMLAAMYAYVADVRRRTFSTDSLGNGSPAMGSEETTSASSRARADLIEGKSAAFWFIIVVCALLLVAGAILGRPDQLIGILVAFYGALLALLPAVIAMLSGYRRWVGWTVALGIGLGVLAAIGFAVWGLFDARASWFGVFVSPFLAWLVPGALSLAHRREGWAA
jgi:hypothetical protein